MIKILDNIVNSKLTKAILSYGILLIIFLVFKNRINDLIIKYLTIDQRSLEQINITWFLLIGLLAIVYSIYKLQLKRYQPSSNLLHAIFSATLFFIILRFTSYYEGWQFISIKLPYFYYVDILGLPLFISTFILLLSLFKKYVFKTKEEEITTNPFVADDPIDSELQDRLDYKKRAKDLISYLERSNFKKSFTIGIVGPWGNGKSSLIALIENEFAKTPLKGTLHIKFLPYLNHNENDIISEFFKQLSAEINKYSGQLSNQVLNYSEKLLKLYKNKSIKEFLSINSHSLSHSSSYDSYKRINSTLEGLNKKFIVFIDDLDRLSNREVLQVLKLVRNTANFKNFIFVIALDKDYVLNILMQKNDISDHTFVDKFFQLEVYLPEIDKTQLKEDFAQFLKVSDLRFKEDFISKVTKAIYRKDNLFDDYISNHRGLKRLVNQLVFDFHSLPDQLNTNDFLNFTYLKMAFPSAIKFLNNNWSDLLPYNPKTKLCELEEVKEENNNGSFDILRNSRLYFGGGSYIPDYGKYKISSSLTEEVELGKINNLSYHQNLLLAKTLIVLFGKGNETEEYTSIKFGSNLRKLLQQKIVENELSSTEFESIFNLENDFASLKTALESGQTQNILDRINFYNTDNTDRIKSIIMVLLNIVNDAKAYNINTTTVLQTLSKFMARVLSQVKKSKAKKPNKEIWETIKGTFLDGDYAVERKLEFLSFLSENRIRMSFDDWGTDEDTLKELSLHHYKSLLEIRDNNLWKIDDYSFYHAYHSARKFQPEDVLNPITIDFWKRNDVSILCAQMTENDAFTVRVFKTSDFATQLFGSKSNYKSFIEKRIGDTDNPGLKEYLDFIRLESYASFRYYIRYEFVHFELIKLKMERISDSNNLRNDEFENVVEIFIKSKDEKTHKITGTNVNKESIPGLINCLIHPRRSGYYSSVQIESSFIHKAISALLGHYVGLLNADTGDDLIKQDYVIDLKAMSILKGKEIILEFVSVQPQSYLSS